MTYPPYGDQPQQPGQPEQAPTDPAPPPSPYAQAPDPYAQQPYGQQPYAQQNPYGQTYDQTYGQPYQPPQAPYGQSYPTYGHQPPAQTNGLAIASLVVSIVSLTAFCGATGFVGAILGHVARRQIRQRGDGGGGIALAGVIIGWIGVAIVVLMVIVIGISIAAEEASEPGYY